MNYSQDILSTILLLILCLLFINSDASLILQQQARPAEFIKWKEVNPLPVNQTLLLVTEDSPNITGNLVYMDYPLYGNSFFLVPFFRKQEQAIQKGAIGIVCYQKSDRRQFGIHASTYGDQLQITAGLISKESYTFFMKNGGKVNVTFLSWDPNPWDVHLNGAGFIIYRAIIFLMFFSATALAIYKLILWKLKRGGYLNIGFICLIMEVLVNSSRSIQGIMAPIYNIYSLRNYDISYTVSFCLTLITGILVIFFWFDVTIDPFEHRRKKCLGIMKIPAIGVISFLIILEISVDISRDFLRFDVVGPLLLGYITLYFLIGVFYFIAGWRILSVKSEGLEEKLDSITKRVVLSGLMNIIAGVTMLLSGNPLSYNPVPYLLVTAFGFISNFFQSLLLISIFNPQSKKERSSKKGQTKTTNSSVGKNDIKMKEVKVTNGSKTPSE